MNPEERDHFDRLVEQVLGELPDDLRRRFEEVPLVVEDFPSDAVMDAMDIEHIDALCGLHSGIPLTERSVEHSGTLPDQIEIYREGILTAAADQDGYVSEPELLHQIRVTVLHELGHHFGLDEDDLRALGYE